MSDADAARPGPGVGDRRVYAVAVLAGLAAGGLTFWASSRTWAALTVRTPGLPVDRVTVDGGDAVPAVGALALVVLASSVAVLAARGRGRVAVGVVMTSAALVAAVLAATAGSAVDDAVRGALLESPAVAGDAEATARLAAGADGTWWRWLALAGSLLGTGVGVLVTARGRRWPAMGRRYEAPGASPAPTPAAEDATETDLWRAIDRGEDPTA